MTAVSDPPGVAQNTYTVTFNRSLVGCVVQAVSGVGDPSGVSSVALATPLVNMSSGGADQAAVNFADTGGTGTDTAFLITAFC